MFKAHSWIFAFASYVLFVACEKNPAEAVKQDFRFELSAQTIPTKGNVERLLFSAVPSEEVIFQSVTITDPIGESIFFNLRNQ